MTGRQIAFSRLDEEVVRLTPVGGGGRLVCVSPHLDDVVLSCGDALAAHSGAVVVTAFAGHPDTYPDLTSWDARAGFEQGADVVAARRAEDAAALAILGATPHWLDFPDPQYGERPSRSVLAEALMQSLTALTPATVMVPVGLFHDDHILTSDAALDVLRGRPELPWFVYADAIYRRVPQLLDERLALLRAAGFEIRPVETPGGPTSDRKRRAVACYRSQVMALERSWDGGVSDAYEPEQLWQITAPLARPPVANRAGEGGRIGDRR
jgi:LmbE family N-acetylglucosaminyl deacetylase